MGKVARPKWVSAVAAWIAHRAVEAWEATRSSSGLDWHAAAQSGGFFLRSESDWTRRHVEQLHIETDRSAFRRLTIDIELPGEDAAFARDGARASFCIPVAWMAKHPATSRLDLRDEEGKSLPLLTREENADISRVALLRALEDATATQASDDMEQAVDLCVYQERGWSRLGSGLLRVIADQEQLPFRDPEERRRIQDTASRLAGDSALWFILDGEPHSRRVIKFGYAIPLRADRLLCRPKIVVVREEELDGSPVELKEIEPGPVAWAASIRRCCQRAMAAMGLGAIDLSVDKPAVEAPDSYHFQVQAPPGLEIRRLRLQATLRNDEGEITPRTQYEGRTGHLYFAGATSIGPRVLADPGTAEEHEPPPITIDVALRVARRGFLNVSVVSALVITAALWGYQAAVEKAQDGENSQVAAAVLLVVPALLVVFAVRPEEHAWAARLLAGVRAVMLSLGLLAAAAAAALVDISPWGQDASEAVIWYAVAASAGAGVLVLAWIASWEPLRWWAGRSIGSVAYAALVVVGGLATAAVAAGRWFDVDGLSAQAAVLAAGGGVLAALTALTVIGTGTRDGGATTGQRVWAAVIAFLAAVALAMALAVAPGDGHTVWAAVCSAAGVAVLAELVSTLLVEQE